MVWRWGAVVTGARARLTGAGTGGGAVVTGTRPRQTDAGTGGGAVVTGTRPRQTETPCPSARNGVALWSRPYWFSWKAVLLAIRLAADAACLLVQLKAVLLAICLTAHDQPQRDTGGGADLRHSGGGRVDVLARRFCVPGQHIPLPALTPAPEDPRDQPFAWLRAGPTSPS